MVKRRGSRNSGEKDKSKTKTVSNIWEKRKGRIREEKGMYQSNEKMQERVEEWQDRRD